MVEWFKRSKKGRVSKELTDLESKKREDSVLSKDISVQIDYCTKIISNIGELYSKADVELKRQIIGSTFPENLIYSEKKCRTTRVNEVIKLLSPSTAGYELKDKGQKRRNLPLSSKVN